MHAMTLKWWTIFRIALEERLVYRGDFALGTLMRFLPIITQIFLWFAIFRAVAAQAGEAAGAGQGGASDVTVFGYTYHDMVAYYLLSMLSRAFSSMPGLASGTARSIRDGEIKKFLIQPVDMVGFLLLSRVAHKLAYYSVALGPFALVFFLCRGYFDSVPNDPAVWAAFVASLVMAFLIGFFLECAIGMIGFWFLEVSSLLFVYMLMSFFLSGHMFPLDMFEAVPGPWSTILQILPFQYLAYFPAAVFLGKVEGEALLIGMLVQVGWVVVFIVMCRTMFHYGVRRYSGYGG